MKRTKTILAVTVALLLVPTVLAQDDYVSDSEKLSQRIEQLSEQIVSKGKDWAQGSKDFVLGATEIEKALGQVERDPDNLAAHISFFKAASAKANELRPGLEVLLNKQNPQEEIDQIERALNEVISLNKTSAERWKMLAGKSPTDSLRERYLKLAASAERMSRKYDLMKKNWDGLNIDESIGVFKAELDFLTEFETYCQAMIVNLKTTHDITASFEEAKNISAALDALANSLERFSKVISGQYDITAQDEEGNTNEGTNP